jgi:hypothetical protein
MGYEYLFGTIPGQLWKIFWVSGFSPRLQFPVRAGQWTAFLAGAASELQIRPRQTARIPG